MWSDGGCAARLIRKVGLAPSDHRRLHAMA
jgi:hypothetical protein